MPIIHNRNLQKIWLSKIIMPCSPSIGTAIPLWLMGYTVITTAVLVLVGHFDTEDNTLTQTQATLSLLHECSVIE